MTNIPVISRISILVSISLVLAGFATAGTADDLSIERLTWAGVKLVSGNTTVFIDAVGTDIWEGKAPEGLVPVTADTARRYALITHAHNDHFDLETLKQVLGDRGYVICHDSIAAYIGSRGLRVIPAKMYEPVTRGGFVFTASLVGQRYDSHRFPLGPGRLSLDLEPIPQPLERRSTC